MGRITSNKNNLLFGFPLKQDFSSKMRSHGKFGMSRLCKYAADFIISIDDWEHKFDILKIDFCFGIFSDLQNPVRLLQRSENRIVFFKPNNSLKNKAL